MSIDDAGQAGKAVAAALVALRKAADALANAEEACDAHDPHCGCWVCDLVRQEDIVGSRWVARRLLTTIESMAPPCVLRASAGVHIQKWQSLPIWPVSPTSPQLTIR